MPGEPVLRDAVKQVIVDVHAGKMHPRTAASPALLFNLQLRAIETMVFERRLKSVETAVEKADKDLAREVAKTNA
jgi:hypothetical protein